MNTMLIVLICSVVLNFVIVYLWGHAERRADRRRDLRNEELWMENETLRDRIHAIFDPKTLEFFRFWQSYTKRATMKAEIERIQAKKGTQAVPQPARAGEQREPRGGAPGPPPQPIGTGPSILAPGNQQEIM